MNEVRLSFAFEFVRTLRKPAFWTATLILPAVALISGLLMTATPSTAASGAERIPFAYSDPSGLVNPSVAHSLGGHPTTNAPEERAARRASAEHVYIVFPDDPATSAVQVYGPDRGLLGNAAYSSLATTVLQQSALHEIADTSVRAAATQSVAVDTHTTHDGVPTRTFGEVIPPMLFAVALFAIMLISGNRMMVSTLEEKENRVIEMLLVGVRPLPFISGKILALFALTGVQIAVILLPSLAVAPVFINRSAWAMFGSVELRLQLGPIIVAGLLLIGALALFTGLLVGIGALTNSAKEAGPYFGGFMVVMVLPVYSITTLLSDPSATFVQVMLYFPLTTPMTALVLNAMGTLTSLQAVFAVLELLAVGALSIVTAARLFRRGALDAQSFDLPRRLRLRHG